MYLQGQEDGMLTGKTRASHPERLNIGYIYTHSDHTGHRTKINTAPAMDHMIPTDTVG